MDVAVFSDLHLRGPEDPNQARFLARLAGLGRVDLVVLLGDIFEHWWHFGDEPFPQYRPVAEALAPFPLVFVPGNHDFHAARWFESRGARVGAELVEAWDGRRVELLHGDHVDDALGYRFSHALLRGRAFAAYVDHLGPARAWPFLARLAGSPGGAPKPRLVAAQLDDARARIAAGAELVFMGHTHAPGIYGLPGGIFVNVGDAFVHRSWVRVRDGVPRMERL